MPKNGSFHSHNQTLMWRTRHIEKLMIIHTGINQPSIKIVYLLTKLENDNRVNTGLMHRCIGDWTRRIASVAALEGDAQYFIICNIGDHCLNFSINMIGFEKVGG